MTGLFFPRYFDALGRIRRCREILTGVTGDTLVPDIRPSIGKQPPGIRRLNADVLVLSSPAGYFRRRLASLSGRSETVGGTSGVRIIHGLGLRCTCGPNRQNAVHSCRIAPALACRPDGTCIN